MGTLVGVPVLTSHIVESGECQWEMEVCVCFCDLLFFGSHLGRAFDLSGKKDIL